MRGVAVKGCKWLLVSMSNAYRCAASRTRLTVALQSQTQRQMHTFASRFSAPAKLRSDVPPLVYHPGYSPPMWPKGHRFPMDKFRLLYEVLLADGLIDDESYFVPTEPPLEWLYKVHLPDYVDRFLKGTLSAQEMRKIGFEHSVELVKRTLLEVGGTVLTCELALRHGLACNLAGGTHHAHRDHGSGFTILNDLAVASRVLLDHHDVQKIFILDLDVHQGDGTATIFSDDARVFTASFHCQDNWPWRKAVSDLDVGLPAGMGDEAYMDKLQGVLPDLIEAVKPDVMFYLSGVDPHVADALGKLSLTTEGVSRREEYVISTAVRMGVPIACVIGGGYDPDTRVVSRRHALLHHAATSVWRELCVKPDVSSRAVI